MYTKNGKKTRGNCFFERNLFLVSPHLVLSFRRVCQALIYGVPRETGLFPGRGVVPPTASGAEGVLENNEFLKKKNRPDREGPNG